MGTNEELLTPDSIQTGPNTSLLCVPLPRDFVVPTTHPQGKP